MIALSHIPLGDILLQQAPFVFIDRALSYTEDGFSTEFTVRRDALFVENGQLLSSGIIENMAQTLAARSGYECRYIFRKPLELGYLAEVRALEISCLPQVGDLIETKAEKVGEALGISLYKVALTVGGTTIASAMIKIATAGEYVS